MSTTLLKVSGLKARLTELDLVQPRDRQLQFDVVGRYTLADTKGLHFIAEFDDDLPDMVMGDPVRVRQVLSNFLSNALKFTSHGGVTVRLYMPAQHGLAPDWTRAQLAQARFNPTVARLIMPPPAGTAKNWAAYRARFVEPVRIRAGAAFWRQNDAALARAEATYRVPADIVAKVKAKQADILAGKFTVKVDDSQPKSTAK